MKIFKHRNFMSLIFSIIVSLPFLSILSRSAYVTLNKNAKDSYYGETINEKVGNLSSYNDLKINIEYNYQSPIDTGTIIERSIVNLYVQDFSISSSYAVNSNPTWNIEDTNIIRIQTYVNDTYVVFQFRKNGENDFYYNTSANIMNFTFTLTNNVEQNSYLNTKLVQFNYFTYNKYSYLDNAFDYSISRFVDENHWGKLNFFQWFTNLFIDINSNNNILYLHFINWYMNYFLMVSCAYILFLVLMWFINYSRILLERGMNYDW